MQEKEKEGLYVNAIIQYTCTFDREKSRTHLGKLDVHE